jgi:hypothetical protein
MTRSSRPPDSNRITSPNHFLHSFSDELPPDEHTAVFAPPPELLARSGRQPAPGSAWEEPTRVVQLGAFAGLASSPTQPPPGGPTNEPLTSEPLTGERPPSEGPNAAQLEFERRLVGLATPVPSPAGRTRWVVWAILVALTGAGIAAIAEYSLHPPPTHSKP